VDRPAALDSPGAAPDRDPPGSDTLDTHWALWGMLRFCRDLGIDAAAARVLDRVTGGDPDRDVGFLDHPDVDVHDGFGDPPRLLCVAAVSDISRALDELDVGAFKALAAWLGRRRRVARLRAGRVLVAPTRRSRTSTQPPRPSGALD
jgi:hypothetical protein